MPEQERKFEGIWIPENIWFCEDLDIIEKCILVEIKSLSKDNNLCYASNEYFSKFFQCSERKISSSISKLISLGLVAQTGFDGRKRYLEVRVENFARLGSKNCEQNNITNNIDNKENIKRNENIVQPSFLANDENQVQNEKVDLETATPTSTSSLIATYEQPSSRQKANKGTDTETKIEQVIDFFDKTYSLYPRKVSRGRAQTTFIHKVFARDYTESRKRALYIYKCLERQIVEWANEGNGKGRGKDFMPYMSSWLNDNFEDVPKKERGKIK